MTNKRYYSLKVIEKGITKQAAPATPKELQSLDRVESKGSRTPLSWGKGLLSEMSWRDKMWKTGVGIELVARGRLKKLGLQRSQINPCREGRHLRNSTEKKDRHQVKVDLDRGSLDPDKSRIGPGVGSS